MGWTLRSLETGHRRLEIRCLLKISCLSRRLALKYMYIGEGWKFAFELVTFHNSLVL